MYNNNSQKGGGRNSYIGICFFTGIKLIKSVLISYDAYGKPWKNHKENNSKQYNEKN